MKARQRRRRQRPEQKPEPEAPLFDKSGPQPEGWIDGVMDGTLYGWYAVPTGTRLVVRVDGRYVGVTRNTVPRDDVVDAGLASEPVGFEIELPAAVRDGNAHVFDVRPIAVETRAGSLVRSVMVEALETQTQPGRRRTRAAVVCWDLGHNPAGRALVLVQVLQRLYDEVDLVGPLFPRFGGKVWAPIADNPRIRIIARRVKDHAELKQLRAQLERQKYDFVWLCKPRWPTLFLGMGLAQASECSVALDIDDYELAFFAGKPQPASLDGVAERIRQDQVSPIDLDATLLAHTAIDLFPVVTVSNVSLQRKFGGIIIRHARDEAEFDPGAYNRDHIRRSYGYGTDDKVVLFVGTIRRHKGVVRVAEAICQLRRPDIKLCLVGPIQEAGIEEEIRELLGPRVTFHNGIPFSALAVTTLMADLVCLPQETGSEVAHFQIPAKMTDALAMGVPVIVENLPPFSDLDGVPGIFVRKRESLARLMARVLKAGRREQGRIRDFFLAEFSTVAGAERLKRQLATAKPVDLRKWRATAVSLGVGNALRHGPANPTSAAISKQRGRELVFLWKQNDSGLFGRRSDMVLRQLVSQGFAGRVLQFDTAISLDNVLRLRDRAEQSPLSADGMVYRNIAARHLGLAHDLQVSRFTLIHDNRKRSFMDRPLPAEADLPEVLRSIFKAERLSEEAMLWICPVTFDLEKFEQARRFAYRVVDIIDDQRSFASKEEYRRRLNDHYEFALAGADVVFANCDGVADRFRRLAHQPIHVVSNAAERISRADVQAIDVFQGRADVFRIGYVGNLRDRIDVGLLHRIAAENPSWQLVLVGPTGGREEIEDLAVVPNITLLGPQRYEDSVRIAAGFDVAIIPHVVGELTASMNPLKLYLYQALGLPVVSTEVENMIGANSLVRVAGDHDAFVRQLHAVDRLRRGTARVGASAGRRKPARRPAVPQSLYWEDNVSKMIKVLARSL